MKKIVIALISLILILLIASYVTQKWLENNLVSLINQNPDRAYDITYEKLDLNILFKGFELEVAHITPLTDRGTLIRGEVEEVQIKGFSWFNLVFSNDVSVSEIIFYRPDFEILLAPQIPLRKSLPERFSNFLGISYQEGHSINSAWWKDQ